MNKLLSKIITNHSIIPWEVLVDNYSFPLHRISFLFVLSKIILLTSYLFFLTKGYVASVCPYQNADHSGYEKTYVTWNVNSGRIFQDYEMLLFVRPVATSPFFSKKKIGEMPPIQFQTVSFPISQHFFYYLLTTIFFY